MQLKQNAAPVQLATITLHLDNPHALLVSQDRTRRPPRYVSRANQACTPPWLPKVLATIVLLEATSILLLDSRRAWLAFQAITR